MSWQKSHDLAVRTGTYQDNTTGKEKGRYENVGHILEGGDGQKLICLKRTFNPAGVVNPDGRDTVVLSMFEVRDKAAGNGSDAGYEQMRARDQQAKAEGKARGTPAPPADEPFNDDIPF